MPEAVAAFDSLAADFFSVWFRFHPDLAVEAGVTGFSRLLPAQDDDEQAALGGWLESLIVALEELDFDGLDRERRIDLELMFAAARVEHCELHQRDWRQRDPLRFLPTGEIYRLTLAPSEDLRGTLVDVLSGIPQHLRLAQTRLVPAARLVAPELTAAAIDEAEKGRCYLRELAHSPWLRKHCHGLSQIDSLADEACMSLAAFAEVLRQEVAPHATGPLGCGLKHLRLLLRHRHFMDCDPMAGCAVLERTLAETQARLDDLCADLGISPQEAPQRLDAVAVDGRNRLESYHVECERLHGTLKRTGLVTLPHAPLHISERPDCPRPHRFGADYVPAWDDERSGTLFLASQDHGVEAPDALARVRGRCLSRTWGGAHLLTFAGGEAARRLPRRLAGGSSLIRGWDLYLRERLGTGEGYGASPEERLHSLLHRRVLILTAQADLALHTGQIGGVELRRRLATDPSTDPARLVGLAQAPGDALAGVLGWCMIREARRLMEQWQGSGFSERAFHDRLVGHGPIPVPLILRHELGADFWDEVRGAVLG